MTEPIPTDEQRKKTYETRRRIVEYREAMGIPTPEWAKVNRPAK